MSNEIFNDMSNLTATGARLAKAQGHFDAAQEKCALIMKPLFEELQAANDTHKQAILQVAKYEEAKVTVDLNTMLLAAQQDLANAQAAAFAAVNEPFDDLQANGLPPGDVVLN